MYVYAYTQFKDIQFAYEVLSDPQRRERYDNFGMSAVKEDGAGAGPGMGMCFNNQAVIIEGHNTNLRTDCAGLIPNPHYACEK